MPPRGVEVVVDNRLRLRGDLPRELVRDLKAAFTHANPDYAKKRSLGLSLYRTPTQVRTYVSTPEVGELTLPRGGIGRLRRILAEHGLVPLFRSAIVEGEPAGWPAFRFTLRSYQRQAVDACIAASQGIVRAPVGGGKTTIALALAAELDRPTLVVAHNRALLDQWRDRAVEQCGLRKRDVGFIGSSSRKVGRHLTLGMQQTLASKKFDLEFYARLFPVVIVDEAHHVGATTFERVVDGSPGRWRFGFTADERRRDRKEFLVRDQFGELVADVDQAELERDGHVLPVEVRLVPTDFRADWYVRAEGIERDFGRLVEEMVADQDRNDLLFRVVVEAYAEAPTFVFTHRVEHARYLADERAFRTGIRCGLLLGGTENKVRFDEDRSRLESGEVRLACGTYQAIGEGIDIPAVGRGVAATPIGDNRPFFNQVRGRVCRPGKVDAALYVLWDRHVFPKMPERIGAWNAGRVRVVG